MCRANGGKASRSGFDERPERVPTIGALLLQVGADGGDVFVVEGFRQKGRRWLSWRNLQRPHCPIFGASSEQRHY
jgi:hypothetical protein